MSNSVALVNAINEGTFQASENARLKALVESSAESVYVAVGALNANVHQSELAATLESLATALKHSEAMKFTNLVRSNHVAYAEEAQQTLAVDELAEGCGATIPPPDVSLPRSDAASLTSDVETILPKLSSHGAPERVIEIIQSLTELAKAVNYPSLKHPDGSSADGKSAAELAAEGAWATLLRPIVSALVTLVTPETVEERFEDVNESLRRCVFDCEDAAAKQEQAFEGGEVEEAVGMFEQRIEVAGKRQEAATQKLELTEEALVQYVREPAKALTGAASTMAGGVDARLTAAQDFDTRVSADLLKLRAALEAVESADVEATSSFAEELAAIDGDVAQLRSEIAQVIAAIVDGETHLKKLSKEMAARCMRRVALQEREMVRREEVNSFMTWAAQQKAALTAASRSVEEERARCDAVEAQAAENIRTAMEQVKGCEEVLVKMRDAALVDFHEAFRDHYMVIGDYMYRTERATEGLKARAEKAAMAQQVAIDSGKTDVKPLADERKRLEAEYARSSERLESIRARLVALAPVYEPVYEAMQQRNIDKQHPVAELEEQLKARRLKLIEYQKIAEMTAPSQAAQLEREKAAIEAARAQLDVLREAAERKMLLPPPVPALPAPLTL